MLWQTLSRLGGSAARHPWRVITVWLLAAGLALGAAGALGGRTTDAMTVPGLDSQRAADLLHKAGSDRAGMTAQVVVAPKDGVTTFLEPGPARTELARLQADIASLPHVLGTNDLAGALAAGREAAVRTGFVSPDGRVAVVRVQYPDQAELSTDDLNALLAVRDRQPADSPLRLEMGGELFFAFSDQGGSAGELVGILLAAAILFLAFGSLVAAALPVGMAALGLAVGAGTITVLAGVTEIPTFAPVLGAMVGLGVGIDYALFVLARHREYVADGVEVHEAAGRAVGTAGQPVVFAGGTVVVSILRMAVAGVPFMTVGGFAVALVVLIMVIASVTLLPAFLGLAGYRINRFGLHRFGLRGSLAGGPFGNAGWRRWIGHVNRHAMGYALGAATLLLALAAPVLALRVGIPDDGSMPSSRTERRAYDLVAQGFGAGANGPLVIAVDLAGDPTVVDRLATAVAADPGIASVAPPQVDEADGVASVIAFPTTGPQEKTTADTVTRLRSSVLPAVIADGPSEAHIGGATANLADVGRRVNDRLPVFVVAVLALSFVLLMLIFRSVFVPLKAVLLNLLSIGASYGVLVMVFQWGWGGSLIGLEATVPVVSFIPMFMFAILFGLSMDYEMFLLSRVREEYLRTGDNDAAIVDGISGTARVITSAALIMITVFLAFVFGESPAIKMLGLGLATAILIDATIVRMVLVPATMTLLGRANWWLPAWLDRVLPGATADADRALPEPARNAPAVLSGK
jgi:RND superfamily putative drug exporter